MIYHGDLFDVLPTLPDASIDACVTDPPYGIGFMGREWDTFKPGVEQQRIVPNRAKDSENPNLKGRSRGPASSPSAVEYDRSLLGQREFQGWTERWAREVFRVLKPGAYIVVCGAPRSFHRMTCAIEDAGFEIRDCLSWLYGQGFPKSLNVGDGRGTALKPSWEPCVLGRKPFKGNLVGNIATHGTGALNIDACRIVGGPSVGGSVSGASAFGQSSGWNAHANRATEIDRTMQEGRWPANVVLDEEAAAMLDEQSGEMQDGVAVRHNGVVGGVIGPPGKKAVGTPDMGYGGGGGASRFYYVAKPSREERDYGIDGRNGHPTVKPVELMRWLVRLVTPPGGTVLDPFTGSGTTGMACRYELRSFIGVEREAEYLTIAERRIAAVAPLFGESA